MCWTHPPSRTPLTECDPGNGKLSGEQGETPRYRGMLTTSCLQQCQSACVPSSQDSHGTVDDLLGIGSDVEPWTPSTMAPDTTNTGLATKHTTTAPVGVSFASVEEEARDHPLSTALWASDMTPATPNEFSTRPKFPQTLEQLFEHGDQAPPTLGSALPSPPSSPNESKKVMTWRPPTSLCATGQATHNICKKQQKCNSEALEPGDPPQPVDMGTPPTPSQHKHNNKLTFNKKPRQKRRALPRL